MSGLTWTSSSGWVGGSRGPTSAARLHVQLSHTYVGKCTDGLSAQGCHKLSLCLHTASNMLKTSTGFRLASSLSCDTLSGSVLRTTEQLIKYSIASISGSSWPARGMHTSTSLAQEAQATADEEFADKQMVGIVATNRTSCMALVHVVAHARHLTPQYCEHSVSTRNLTFHMQTPIFVSQQRSQRPKVRHPIFFPDITLQMIRITPEQLEQIRATGWTREAVFKTTPNVTKVCTIYTQRPCCSAT